MKDWSTNFHSFETFDCTTTNIYRLKIMSVNDKVKVIWKTNCQWKDRPHFPKRKEIKLDDSYGEDKYASLKNGDKVKVKFGSRWYNAEVVENWDPKSKKGEHYFVGKEFSYSKFV